MYLYEKMLYFDEQDCMILDHRSQSDGCCRNVVEEEDCGFVYHMLCLLVWQSQ